MNAPEGRIHEWDLSPLRLLVEETHTVQDSPSLTNRRLLIHGDSEHPELAWHVYLIPLWGGSVGSGRL